jgi:hypothetical protein
MQSRIPPWAVSTSKDETDLLVLDEVEKRGCRCLRSVWYAGFERSPGVR